MASDRDRRAAQLRRARLSYEQIAGQLGFTDRRAAHRAVARGLAEPAMDDAMSRAQVWRDLDQRLQEMEWRMLAWLEQAEPRVPGTLDHRAYFKVMDALWRVNLRRCRLWGLFTHPWRYDQWYRRDVPVRLWWDLHRQSAELERQARIPQRFRSPTAARRRAPVVPLHPVPAAPLVDVDALVPVSVRRLLDAA